MLISQTTNGDTYFWDMPTGTLIQSFISEPSVTPCIALDPQNNFVAFMQGEYIQVFRLPELTFMQSIDTINLKPIQKLIISPNSQILAIVYMLDYLMPNAFASYGSIVDFWHLPTQKWNETNIPLPRPTTSGPIEKAQILISPQWDFLFLALEYERNDFGRFRVSTYQLSQTEKRISNDKPTIIKSVIESFWGCSLNSQYSLNSQGTLLATSSSSESRGMTDIKMTDINLYRKDTSSKKLTPKAQSLLNNISNQSMRNSIRKSMHAPRFTLTSKITIDRPTVWLACTSKNIVFRKRSTFEIQIMPLNSFGERNKTITAAKGVHVNSATIYDNESKLATGSTTGEIKLWELRNGKACGTLSGHISPITNFAVTEDGKLLASSDLHNIVKLWRLT